MAGWTIGFDADDTLWHNERFFRGAEARIARLLVEHAEGPRLSERLVEAQRRNLALYGFGVKAFVLSMVETAIEVSEGRVPASAIAEILAEGRGMLDHPVELLPHAREAVEAARGAGEVVLVTKGDLLHQERKLAASGLGDLFDAVEIVSEKRAEVYARVFARHGAGLGVGLGAGLGGKRAMMVGNSIKSDVLPAIEAGAWGVHVASESDWVLDRAEAPTAHPRFRAIPDLGALPGLLRTL